MAAVRPSSPARGSEDANGVPVPGARGTLGRARAIASRAFAETIPLEANGHQNGHQNGQRAVPGQTEDRPVAASTAQLASSDNPRDSSTGA